MNQGTLMSVFFFLFVMDIVPIPRHRPKSTNPNMMRAKFLNISGTKTWHEHIILVYKILNISHLSSTTRG